MIDKFVLSISQTTFPARVLAFTLSFFAPLATVIHVIIILLIADAITSIYYQMKQLEKSTTKYDLFIRRIQVIQSGRLRTTLEKMFFYIFILTLFYLFELYILQIKPTNENSIYLFSLTNIAAIMVAIVELTSIGSNVSKITRNPVFNRIILLFTKKVNTKMEIDDETKNI